MDEQMTAPCDRCGGVFPLSELIPEDDRAYCRECYDDLLKEEGENG
jgi:formylmethanofuran dehydrogenase subunit E